MKAKFKKLTEKDKTRFTRISLAMVGIAVNNHTAESLWRIFERMSDLGGKFSLRDGSEIQAFMDEKIKKEHEAHKVKARAIISEAISGLPKGKQAAARLSLERVLLNDHIE